MGNAVSFAEADADADAPPAPAVADAQQPEEPQPQPVEAESKGEGDGGTTGDAPPPNDGGDEKEEESQDEGSEEKVEIKMWTPPVDRRFPSANQARTCYTRYNEFYKCMAEKGDESQCTFYKKCYQSLCPIEWVERWEEQREEGAWPGRY